MIGAVRPHDRLVDSLLEEAERVAAEIRASGRAEGNGAVVVKGAGRRDPPLTVGMKPPPPKEASAK